MKYYLLFALIMSVFAFESFPQVFWDEVPTGVSVQLNSVSNVSGQVAWACGQNGTVIKTTNNGYNWTNVSGNGIPNTTSLVSISAYDANTALTAGYVGANTFLYRTTNAGLNWSQVFTQANGFINTVWVIPLSFAFMQGDPVGGRWSLWKTSNYGLTWDSAGLYLPQAGSETGWNNSFWFFGGKIWFGTNNTKIYHSSTNGTSWLSYSTTGLTDIYTVSFDTNTYNNTGGGYAGGISLMKSTNTGQNWSAVTVPGAGNIYGAVKTLLYPNGSWITRGSSIYYSNNFGVNWTTQFTTTTGTYTHLARYKSLGFFTGPGYMYATKSNGGISRANLFVEGVKLISSEVPEAFRLFQNYPNPFNPTTKIIFSQARLSGNATDMRGAFISLKVYDAIGREAAVLHDKIIQPGTYEAEWDASNMPSGIYYYRLLVSDPVSNTLIFQQARKMVLIK